MKLQISKQVIKNIIEFAKINHPKEFIALLKGESKNNIIKIKELIYQPYTSSNNSTFFKMNLPLISDFIGTVHSHPSPNSLPSKQDLLLFNKRGLIHIIISYPYNKENIKFYDSKGNTIPQLSL